MRGVGGGGALEGLAQCVLAFAVHDPACGQHNVLDAYGRIRDQRTSYTPCCM